MTANDSASDEACACPLRRRTHRQDDAHIEAHAHRRCAGASFSCFWIIVALLGPVIAPFGEGDIVSMESFKVVDEAGFLGTDYLGRDLLSRIIFGARMTLGLAMIATLLSFSTGIALGFAAAIAGGWLDQVLSRAVDAIMAFPSIMLALIIIGGVGTSLPVVILTVAMIDATRVYRLSRALALDASVMDYVEVARARGEGPAWIMVERDICPIQLCPWLRNSEFATPSPSCSSAR